MWRVIYRVQDLLRDALRDELRDVLREVLRDREVDERSSWLIDASVRNDQP